MSSTVPVAANMLDRLIRHLRPRWIRSPIPHLLDDFERFSPLQHLTLPMGDRLSVVAPHPDDESIGCGGLIRLWRLAGCEAEVVFLTDGALGSAQSRDASLGATERISAKLSTALRRNKEAAAALSLLDASAHWFDGTDGSLFEDEARLVVELSAHWSRTPPHIVATPYPADRHPDHAAAARIVAKASVEALGPEALVLAYEVWSPVPANCVLDISSVAETKWQAIAAHASQVATTDYVAAAMGLGTFRSVTSGLGDGAAEAFRSFKAQDYYTLAESLRV